MITNRNVKRHTDLNKTAISEIPDLAHATLARGTREFSPGPMPTGAMVEHQLGVMWMVDLRVETLTRNLQIAGAIEAARRLGEAFPRWGLVL